MKYIAHRGLIKGPNECLENHPDRILSTLKLGFDCEIDLRVDSNKFVLGHDRGQYEVTSEFLTLPGLWIHCKNPEALFYCQRVQNLNYFWHETDSYTITSKGWGWAYPGRQVSKWTIQVMPETVDPKLQNISSETGGVCSDWILRIRSEIIVL
jgi:hypothetical protein